MRASLLITLFFIWSTQLSWAQLASVSRASIRSASAEPDNTPPAPETLSYADQMPAFAGGAAALHRYLLAKTSYPAGTKRRGLSGTVVVQFVVDEEGRPLDPAVVKTGGADFDAEALRLVRLMPWWTPGQHQGQPARVRCTLPIVFTFKR